MHYQPAVVAYTVYQRTKWHQAWFALREVMFICPTSYTACLVIFQDGKSVW